MGLGNQNDISGEQLYQALRGLTGEELDRIVQDQGSVDGITQVIETKFRALSQDGLFKKTAIEEAFTTLDKKHTKRFSKAYKGTTEEWADSVRLTIRAQLVKVNKRGKSQAARDAAAAAKDASDAMKRPAAAVQQGSSSGGASGSLKAAPAAPSPEAPEAPSGLYKAVQVPVGVDEAVLAAAIQAAMRVKTASVGGVTVSVPESVAPRSAPAAKPEVMEDEVEDEDSSDDEGDADEEPDAAPRSVKKRPAGFAKTSAAKLLKLPAGR